MAAVTQVITLKSYRYKFRTGANRKLESNIWRKNCFQQISIPISEDLWSPLWIHIRSLIWIEMHLKAFKFNEKWRHMFKYLQNDWHMFFMTKGLFKRQWRHLKGIYFMSKSIGKSKGLTNKPISVAPLLIMTLYSL